MRLLLLVLVACSSTPRDAPLPRQISADAAIDAPVVVDAAVATYRPCDWNEPDAKNPRCAPENMPLVPCRQFAGPTERFPCKADKPPVTPHEPIVLAIKKRGERTERGIPVTVDGGTNRGIDRTWRAVLLDSKQRPLVNGTLDYARLDPDEIECLTRLHPERVAQAASVRFSPPTAR